MKSIILILGLFFLGNYCFAGDVSDYRKPIGGEDNSGNTSDYKFQGYGGSTPEARQQNEDRWGYHHKEDYRFKGFGTKEKKQEPPAPEPSRGAINPETGKFYPPVEGGVIDPETGKFYPKSAESGIIHTEEEPSEPSRGAINPETGKFYPSVKGGVTDPETGEFMPN